ncbi:gluconolaconase [Rathayibacter sp. VKM Ac-2856]|uniref:L-dopachrome tautomerase-related protein n=1 Tax=unclassified Rathayibacter TaxID=2609250 RepID=UPI001565ABDB|nr:MULTISPECIES: L-dopachrome tautomerase-related protein [unclassified Rathayibacter]NQX06540.1 gluconolaconase [Rathayibacter sp. VKM Ac-2858]NQX21707.1 gluconolaconase [Rathayibacter sp. VKM Ac-2856]
MGFWGPNDDDSHGRPRPVDEPLGSLEVVHEFADGPMPTGVSVSHTGRIFVNFPKWGDEVPATVVELRDGVAVPFPDEAWNSPDGDDDAQALVSVQSIVVDPADRLWILDTGSPLFQPTKRGGPKLVCVDLATDTVEKVIVLEPDVALPTTYLNDIRFDLRRGVAYITDSADSGPNGLIVVDLESGDAWRRLHDHPSTKALTPPELVPMAEGRVLMKRPADGEPEPVTMGSDGIAISADGERLWYCPLVSRRWYSVATEALVDRGVSDEDVAATVVDEGDKGGGADGLETDDRGRFYATNYENNAIVRRRTDGTMETLVHDERLLWPDTMSIATDGHLYVTANQLHRQADYQGGTDLRTYPYSLFRIAIDAGPVLLR